LNRPEIQAKPLTPPLPMNRSSRRESALIRWSGLTSAATRFRESFHLERWTRIEPMNPPENMETGRMPVLRFKKRETERASFQGIVAFVDLIAVTLALPAF